MEKGVVMRFDHFELPLEDLVMHLTGSCGSIGDW